MTNFSPESRRKNVNSDQCQWTVPCSLGGIRCQSCQRLPTKIVLKTFKSDKKDGNNFNNLLKTYYSTSKHLIKKKHLDYIDKKLFSMSFHFHRHLKWTKLEQKQLNYPIFTSFVLIRPAVTLRWPCHGLEVTPPGSPTPTHVSMCTSVGLLHMKLKYWPLV